MMVWGRGVQMAVRGLAAAALAAALASCGGGQQVVTYVPQRIIAFGDETSVIVDSGDHNGRKYTINYLSTDANAVIDCKSNPLWIQVLGFHYNIVFPQCNRDNVVAAGLILAAVGATAGDVKTQVDQFLGGGGTLAGSDLITVLAGANDIKAANDQVEATTLTEDQATAIVEQAGSDLAVQVNRLATLGAKVLISTTPDVGLTPYAVAEPVVTGRADRLSRLSSRFNSKLRIGLVNDGRMIGLVLNDELISGYTKSLGTFVDVWNPACTTASAFDCTTLTLKDYTGVAHSGGIPANQTQWLWADNLHLAPTAQGAMGSAAVGRAVGNPF
jgi:outer membrane lipase/esterase